MFNITLCYCLFFWILKLESKKKNLANKECIEANDY